MTLLEEAIQNKNTMDQEAMAQARRRWDSIAKPLNSLGLLEDYLVQIAGITGSSEIAVRKKAVAIFCSDNGIVEEGVTQTGQEVTAVVTENFSRGDSCACIMAKQAGAWVFPVDIGVNGDLSGYGEFQAGKDKLKRLEEGLADLGEGAHTHPILYPIWNRKLARGTRNFVKEPAMERDLAVHALETGICLAGLLKERGYGIIATGEMGIGNTTTSSAVIAALLQAEPELVTGRGAGLSLEGFKRKCGAIRAGLEKWQPDPSDGIDVLSKVGGLDLAGLAGMFMGGRLYRIPVVADGLISLAAALAAERICPGVKGFILASHMPAEPAGAMVLEALGQKPLIHGRLCLGEGTGAVALFPLLDMAVSVYHEMSTFSQIQVEEYQHFSD